MRAKIFRILIKKLRKRTSKIYRNIQLQELLWLTAKAFGVKSKWILFSKNPLEQYMLFSKKAMAKEVDLARVFDISYKFGKDLRACTGLSEADDLKELVYLLYQYIGIDMVGQLPEEFLIKKCYFSNFYNPDGCQKMSAMDSGIIAGIYSELIPKSRLIFSERLTEGCSHCKASFQQQ